MSDLRGLRAPPPAEEAQLADELLSRLILWLKADFPRDVVMPMTSRKEPCFAHKGGAWTWLRLDECLPSMMRCPKSLTQVREATLAQQQQHVGILLRELCVLDFDDEATALSYESLFLELREAPCETTCKGRHYFFRRPAFTDSKGFYDGARQTADEVDFKSVCATGTSGTIVVAPSDGKSWDSPYEYKAFLNGRILDVVRVCNGSHNSVANVCHAVLRDKYVCATANGKLWYEFTGALWKEDKEGVHLHNELSTSVRDQFIFSVNRITSTLSIQNGSSNAASNDNRRACEALLQIVYRLQDCGFKDCVLREMREFFYDPGFLSRLDSDPNLLAFDNGVWDLAAQQFRAAAPQDYVSLSVGYAYAPVRDETLYGEMQKYWATLHPDPEQHAYTIKTLARQLQGDVGHNLFHIHAGFQGSAGNGKSTFFDVLEMALGAYVRKFGVEMLVAKQRVESGKPMPEFQYWRGRRILYCTEPAHDDVLNAGIMKDLTGGEKILYRLLYSNDV
ncbi:hypothetical protein GPECTOR_147g16 [Gonium pectorale]|uniref:SF3 helicase domain-containing protein n=1 Tax=Gonium pectorale TaxID=33097 RepID=A0A150FXT8_GONPE|nr:hypothetical protein GPECTOR_147g16 [Gonium pectorale]|eukprot:KXZ42432.1 hypothetical protein GPECTOR_147g16 [Gonium pectorale]